MDDIYMKGVAFRYRALKTAKATRYADKTILSDLMNSEKWLKQTGAQIQLAWTWIALGRYFLDKKVAKKAQIYLSKAWYVFSTIDNDLFPDDLLDVLPHSQRMESIIDRITRINESLGTTRDASSFLQRAINTALDSFMAKRAAFFVLDASGVPQITASRNFDTSSFRADTLRSINELVQETAAADGALARCLRRAGTNDGVCVPARLDGKTYGFLYLDEWLGGKLPADYLPFVRMLCSQIALGLVNISAYTRINTLKTRFEDEAHFYRREMAAGPLETIVGTSAAIKYVLNQIPRVAPTDSAVLITGETGTGKDSWPRRSIV